MADTILNPTITTTTSTKTEAVPAAEQTPSVVLPTLTDREKRLLSLNTILALGDKYGLGTVAFVLMLFLFVVPMRDGHLKFLEITGQAVKDQVETSRQIGTTNAKIAEGVEKLSDAIDAVSDQNAKTGDVNKAVLDRSVEHFQMSKETHDDVKVIKEAVVKPKPK